MGKYMYLEIDNRKKSAIPIRKTKLSGQWKDPGAKLYDQLLNAQHIVGNKVPDDAKEFEQLIKEGKYITWQTYLKEAYMVAPVDDIKNSPYGVTPFSRSGCKYPHHVIKNGKLVVSIPGLRAAYITARNNGVLVNHTPENKKIVAHFNRHFKELGLKPEWRYGEFYLIDESAEKIERNFQSIYEFIDRSLGTNIVEEKHRLEYFDEGSHGKLKYDFRMGWDYDTGHQIKIVYSLDGINVTAVGDFYWKYNKSNRKSDGSYLMDGDQYLNYVKDNITRKGNNDHQSKGQKVLAIIDTVTGAKMTSVKLMSPYSLDGTEEHLTRYSAIPNGLLQHARDVAKSKNGITVITVGEVDNNPSYKSTKWFKDVTNKRTGEDFRFNKLAKAEFIKIGRGIKPESIRPMNFRLHDDPTASPIIYNNPNKKEALQYLYGLERNSLYFIKLFKHAMDIGQYPRGWDYNRTNAALTQEKRKLYYIQKDIQNIESGKYNVTIMKKYQEAALIEEVLDQRMEYLNTHSEYSDRIPPSPELAYYERPINDIDDLLEYFDEGSHGKLKYAFRMGINKDNGHLIDVVFDLKRDNILSIGSHDDTNVVSDADAEEITKNINKTGYPDFVSAGTVLAIIDRDTKERLNTVAIVGIQNGNQLFASKPLKEREDIIKNGVPFIGAKRFTVGEKEKLDRRGYGGSYKTTVHPRSIKDLSTKHDGKFLQGKELLKYGRGYKATHRTDIIESAMSNEAIILDSETMDEIGRTPEKIYEWMHENIEYDNEIDNWKLRSPSEVYIDRKGNSHDQALFVAFHLHSLNIVNGTLFFAEFNKDESINGRTHTLTWFRKGGNGYSDFKEPFDDSKKYDGTYEYYWFENAWSSQSGIHGPYSNIAELKADVFLKYKDDPDVNQDECGGIVFSDHGNHQVGMTISEYNNSWRLEDRMKYYLDTSKTLNEFASRIYEFMNDNSADLMDNWPVSELNEKSHGALKYCYRVGFDVNTGREVAVEFILDPDTITKIGDAANIKDASMKSNMKVNVARVAEDAVDIAKKNIRKYGHIDFTTNALKIHRIFFRGGKSIDSVDFIPMFSKEVTSSMNKVARFARLPKGTSSLDVFNHKEFPGILQREIQSNHTTVEHYRVGEISGKDKYKTTKLMWDHDLFLSYKYTPVLRGVNGKGRYVHNKLEDINYLRDYLKKNLNNRYSESYKDDISIVDSIFKESSFHGLTAIGVNIPYDIGYGYSLDEPIDYIYTEAITFDSESMDCGNALIMEDGDAPVEPPSIDDEQPGQTEPKEESMPKQTDRAESDKNGVRRKKLYIAFIEWCKAYNNKNTFGSLFDKDTFKVTYPFVPDEMRYFYRLANPILCVLGGDLTFFQVSELRKLNQSNHRMNEMLIFAATPNDMRIFNIKDKKIYRGTDENGQIKLNEVLGDTFDTYLQKMINQGDILNGPIDESFEFIDN